MRIYVSGKTDYPDITIESITVKTKAGTLVRLDWDESDYSRDGIDLNMRGKGVYIEDEYANGRLNELIGCEVIETNCDADENGTYLTIESITLEDGDDKYDIENLPFHDN